MLTDEIKPGATCEIRPVDLTPNEASSKDLKIVYTSTVKTVNNDGTVDLTIPVFNDEKVDLLRNTRYSFMFIQPHKMMTAQGVFLQRLRIDNVPMAKIKISTALKKLQRRDYYRINCNIPMYFQIVSLRAEDFDKQDYMVKVSELLEDNAWKTGTIEDISGGGMRFVSEAAIMDLPYFYATFYIGQKGEEKRIGLTGKILSRLPVPRSLDCTYRVKFIPEHSKAQDIILAYVNSQQLVVAKKETGR